LSHVRAPDAKAGISLWNVCRHYPCDTRQSAGVLLIKLRQTSPNGKKLFGAENQKPSLAGDVNGLNNSFEKGCKCFV